MIFVTGDLHGSGEKAAAALKKIKEAYPDAPRTLIVMGDFGFVLNLNLLEKGELDQMEASGTTICFIDGNHENFDALNALPESEWNGGRVHIVRPHVLHLMRGECFRIEGKTFFTMGGGFSTDKQLRLSIQKAGGPKGWWEQELPTKEEYEKADRTIERIHCECDYVLTHSAPRSVIQEMGFPPYPGDEELPAYLDSVRQKMRYRHWFFGHLHQDRDFSGNLSCLFRRILLLPQ